MGNKKIQVVFDEQAMDILTTLRVSSGSASLAEVLRDAVGFYDWVRREIAAGRTIATVDVRENKVREFLTPFQTRGGDSR